MKKGKNKICIITPNFNGGGAQKIAINLANYYSKEYLVDLISFKPGGSFEKSISSNVNIKILNVRTRYAFFKLIINLKISKPDIVISVIRGSNIVLGFSSFFYKSKIIYREASTLDKIFLFSNFKRFLFKKLLKLTYKRADKIIANSYDTRNDLIKNNIVSLNKCVVLGNPVLPNNIDELINAKISEEWFDNSNIRVILNVGRLSREKNQIFLLQAFAIAFKKDSSLRLLIIGEGDYKQKLIKLSIELGISNYFKILPFTLNPFPYFNKSDLFVLTSLFEGFGNVIVEAMACETPIISLSCKGGPSMILKNGIYGKLLSENISHELLSESIIYELNNKNLKKIAAAKENALSYSIECIGNQYIEF